VFTVVVLMSSAWTVAAGTLTVARPVKKIDKAAVYLTKVRLKLKIYFSLKIIFYS
jgi:hypothetical protein